MNKKPEISVIMSTYNEDKIYLIQAIDSILNQTYRNFEFLIVLDNPENKMIRQVVKSYARNDERIKIIENDRNIGLTNSLNKALNYAQGSLIARMDADDIADIRRIEIEMKILKEKRLDLIAASKVNIDENGNKINEYINHIPPELMSKLLPYDNSINHPTVLVKRDVLKELDGYRDIPSCEDYDLWIRMLCKGYKMMVIPNILVKYRVRADSVTRSDEYRRYVSECFIRKMYRKYKKKHKHFMTLHEYEIFKRKYYKNSNTKDRFNDAYKMYCLALENCSNIYFLKYFFKAMIMDRSILFIFLKKINYHIRKRILL